MVSDIDRI